MPVVEKNTKHHTLFSVLLVNASRQDDVPGGDGEDVSLAGELLQHPRNVRVRIDGEPPRVAHHSRPEQTTGRRPRSRLTTGS